MGKNTSFFGFWGTLFLGHPVVIVNVLRKLPQRFKLGLICLKIVNLERLIMRTEINFIDPLNPYCSWSQLVQLTGDYISGHYFRHYFLFIPSPHFTPISTRFLCRLLFSEKECLDQKTYFAKVDGSTQKPKGCPLSRPHWPFWEHLAAILDF